MSVLITFVAAPASVAGKPLDYYGSKRALPAVVLVVPAFLFVMLSVGVVARVFCGTRLP